MIQIQRQSCCQALQTLMLWLFAAMLLGAMGAGDAQGAARCRKTGSTCVEGAGTRIISGTSVYRDCWRYRDTYQCADDNYIDYCAAISRVVGCYQTNSQCTQYFGSECIQYQNTYQCGTPQSTSAGVVLINEQHTIVTDSIDRSECASLESNSSCKLARSVCTDPGGYRTVDGQSVYKECWGWTEHYTCIADTHVNYCTPLQQREDCSEVDQTCIEYAWNGSCNQFHRTFFCGEKIPEPLPSNVVDLGDEYTIVDDGVDASQCEDFATNPNCTLASHICVEPAETRNINGLDVYKDCWAWEDKYVCGKPDAISDCGDLYDDPACNLVSANCLDSMPSGVGCALTEKVFQCKVRDESTEEVMVCGTGICAGGVCTSALTEPDKDFGYTIAALEAGRQLGNYIDLDDMRLFKGGPGKCSVKIGGVSNCCKITTKAASGGSGASNAVAFGAVRVIGNEAIAYAGSGYMFDALSSFINAETLANIYSGLKINPTDYTFLGEGRLSFWGIEYVPGHAGPGGLPIQFSWTSLAFAVAMHIVTEFLQCDMEDQVLAMQRSQGLCSYVGSYCGQKVLGACVVKKEAYCCFNSKLARIINEQGLPQLGRGFGDPEDPDCSGFEIQEVQALDFSQIDLDEFIEDIVPKDFDIEKFTDRVSSKAASRTNNTNYFQY